MKCTNFLFLVLILLPLVSANTIQNSTINTTYSNTSLTFSVLVNYSQILVKEQNITIYNLTCSNTNLFNPLVFYDAINSIRDIDYYCHYATSTQGGGIGYIPLKGIDSNLCNELYEYYLKYGNNTNHLFEINKVINQTSKKFHINYSVQEVKRYIYNWLEFCQDKVSCDTKINKIVLNFDMDTSIGFFKIDINSCKTIQYLKWIFRIESKGVISYEINGLKVWWIIVVIFINLIILTWRLNKYHQKTLERKKNAKNLIKSVH